MTAPLSPAPALTAEEAARVAVFDAAEEPEEVVVERVARAMWAASGAAAKRWTWPNVGSILRDHYRTLAAAALAALRGDRAPLAGQHTTDEEADRG